MLNHCFPGAAAKAVKRGGGRQILVGGGLGVNDGGGIRAVPLGRNGIGTGWDASERGAGNNLEKGMVHLSGIRFEVALDVDYRGGCGRGEKISLFPSGLHEI